MAKTSNGFEQEQPSPAQKQRRAVFHLDKSSLGYGEDIILRDIDLEIIPGEKIALIGSSGSGKSTLLRHLRKQAPDDVAWCPQSPALVPLLSVFHNIHIGVLHKFSTLYNLVNLARPFPKAMSSAEKTASLLGIEEFLNTPAQHLSGGQQQRVGLARALIQERPIFLGDEPVSAVDEYQAMELVRLICRKHETVVIALHDVDLALENATRIIGLRDGSISLDVDVATATTDQIAALYLEQESEQEQADSDE